MFLLPNNLYSIFKIFFVKKVDFFGKGVTFLFHYTDFFVKTKSVKLKKLYQKKARKRKSFRNIEYFVILAFVIMTFYCVKF